MTRNTVSVSFAAKTDADSNLPKSNTKAESIHL